MSIPRLHIPLTAPGLSVVRLIQGSLSGACVIFLLVMGWLWWEDQQLEASILEQEHAVAAMMETARQFRQKAEAKGFNLSDQWLQALPQHVAFAEELVLHQKFSWTQFLNDLESAVPPRISMDSVVLDFKNSSITLSGSALTLDDLSALVDRLEQHPSFRHVVLENHRVQKKKKKGTRPFSFIAFNLEVTYQPGSDVSTHSQRL